MARPRKARYLLTGEKRLGQSRQVSKEPKYGGSDLATRSRLRPGQTYAKAAEYGEQIRAELTSAKVPALLVLDREFETQSVDPDVSRAGKRAWLV